MIQPLVLGRYIWCRRHEKTAEQRLPGTWSCITGLVRAETCDTVQVVVVQSHEHQYSDSQFPECTICGEPQ